MSKARDLANAGTALTTVSATELGYLDGVTSAVQTQLNAQIPKSTVTTKGDLLVATGSGTIVRQGVGTDGQVLTANSAQADGVEWTTLGGSSANYTLLNSGGTSLSGSTLVTVSGISGIEKLIVLVVNADNATNYNLLYVLINGDTGANYDYVGNATNLDQGSTNFEPVANIGDTLIRLGQDTAGGSTNQSGAVYIDGGKSTGYKSFSANGNGGLRAWNIQGIYKGSAAITSISVGVTPGGNFTGGTVYVYGSAN